MHWVLVICFILLTNVVTDSWNFAGSACPIFLMSGVAPSQLTESTHWCQVRDCPVLYKSSPDGASARFARLNSTGYVTGAWIAMPGTPGTSTNQYVQVDFKRVITITGIALQGRDSTTYHGPHQYVTKFKVMLSMDCTSFNVITSDTGADVIFEGNSDPETIVIRHLPLLMIARCIRINPVKWMNHISLRFDVLGC